MEILYVDDDLNLVWLFRRVWFRTFPDIPVHTATDEKEALRLIDTTAPSLSLAVIDWRLGLNSGENLVQQLRQRFPHLPILCISGVRSSADVAKATAAGADGFLERDLSMITTVREIMVCVETLSRQAAPH